MTISNEILGLVSQIHDSLRARGETLSTAESLTAGGLSSALTIVPGASDVFLGSTVAYRPDVKVSHLKVEQKIITEHSVVSEEVALQMGRGANESFGSTWAIATTGVAGPGHVPEELGVVRLILHDLQGVLVKFVADRGSVIARCGYRADEALCSGDSTVANRVPKFPVLGAMDLVITQRVDIETFRAVAVGRNHPPERVRWNARDGLA